MSAVKETTGPPPWPAPPFGDEVPEGYRMEWFLRPGWWEPTDEPRGCRYTTGPGHQQCRKPSVATLLRGSGQRWHYCADHLYGAVWHGGQVWSRRLVSLDGKEAW